MRNCRYYQLLMGCMIGMGLAIEGSGSASLIEGNPVIGAIPSSNQLTRTVTSSTADQNWLAQRRLTNQPDFFEQGQEQFEREITRLQQQPPGPVLTVDTASGQWQPITSSAGNFSIWMPPGTLTEETKELDTAIGRLNFKVMASNSGGNRSVVAYTDLPQNAANQATDKVLSAVRDRLKSRATDPLADDRSISIASYPGRELTFQGSDNTITVRYYLVPGRLYLMGAKYQSNMSNNPTSTFLNSFQLLK